VEVQVLFWAPNLTFLIITPPIFAGCHLPWGCLYYRCNLSHRNIDDLLAQRAITVSYESVRLWCIKFGALYAARRLKRKYQYYDDTSFIEDAFMKINDQQRYLWRVVDQDISR